MRTCYDGDSDDETDEEFDDLQRGAKFKDFQELVECPPLQKHHIPISSSEMTIFEGILHETDSEWKEAVRKAGVLVQKKTLPGNFIMVRFMMECDVDPLVMFHMMVDPVARSEWDTTSNEFGVVATHDRLRDIIRYIVPVPIRGLGAREFVLHRRVRVESTPMGDIYSMVQRSAQHQACPETGKCARMEMVLGGYTLTCGEQPNTMKLLGGTVMDLKIPIPGWIVNTIISKTTIDHMTKMRNAATQRVNCEEDARRSLDEWLKRYKVDNNTGAGQTEQRDCSTSDSDPVDSEPVAKLNSSASGGDAPPVQQDGLPSSASERSNGSGLMWVDEGTSVLAERRTGSSCELALQPDVVPFTGD